MAALRDRPTFRLFLDLDGVLADFDRGVEAITGKRPDQLATRTMWQALARAPDFYGALHRMEDAHELWEHCRPYAPTILTGLPLGTWAEAQKRRWVEHMLGAHVQVITCLSREKHRYSGPDHVLVDDRASLREAWEAKGGMFLLHTSAASTIAALRELGL